MEFADIPEAFQSRIRMAIIAALASGTKSFSELKTLTNASDGNLSVHLTRLEADGYLTCVKTFQGKKPLSTYAITEMAYTEFAEYVALLERTMRAGKLPENS